MSIQLNHAGHIDSNVLRTLQQAGRQVGLSLEQMELLGQDVEAIFGFLAAVDEGRVSEYIDTLYWGALEQKLEAGVVFVSV